MKIYYLIEIDDICKYNEKMDISSDSFQDK